MAVIESKYIEIGSTTFGSVTSYGYSSLTFPVQGDVSDTANGSTNDDVSGLFSGADLKTCQWSNFNYFSFLVSGNRANSGFDTIEVGGTTFSRSAATHSYNSNNNTTAWSWYTTTNPIGTGDGDDVLVEWDDGTTSSTPTIDSVTPSSSTVNEGSSVTFTVSVSNYANGNKTFGWSINNTTTSAADFANSTTSGNVVISSSGGSGSNTVTITTVADSTTEGNQTFTLTVDDPTSNATATSTTVTIVDTSQTPSTPVISSVSQDNPASTTVTTTVNLSTSTTGIEYAQSTTNSVPSTGWQTSNQFTQSRNTTRYYWASTNRNTSGFSTGFSKTVGYFAGDPSVDAPSLSPSSPIAASYSGNVAATITGGTSGTRYRIRNTTTGAGCGNTGDGNGTIQIGSLHSTHLPDPGETDNYEVQYKVLTSNGGNDNWASVSPARTFSISRTAAVCPTTNTTHTITGVTAGSSQTLSQTSKVTSGNNLSISLTTPYSAATGFPTGPGDKKSQVIATISSGGGSRSVSHSGTNATITYTPPYRTTQGTSVLTITHYEYEAFGEADGFGGFNYTWNIAYTDTITLTVTVCPQTQTIVDITSVDSVTPNENTTDQVTATVTTPGGVTVSSYAWSTTGNITLSSSTVQSPVLSFGNVTADSSASVSVTVTDSNNNTATDTQNYTIQFVNQSPVAIIQGPSSTDVDSAVTYSGSDSYDPDGQSLQYQWSASNGGETFTQAKSTNSSFSFTPTETGSYTVTLTAYDSLNSTNVTTKSLLSTSTDTENTGSAGGFGFEIYAANGDTILRADELLIRKAPAVTLNSSGAASTSIAGTESQTTILGIQGTNSESALSLSSSGTTTKSVSLSGGAANTRVSLFLLR